MSDDYDSARTIWNRLKTNYATKSTLFAFLKFKKDFTATLNDSKPLSEQIEVQSQVWKEINDSGILSNYKLLHTFSLLASLPDSYNNLVEPIFAVTKPTNIKFGDIKAKIATEESRRTTNVSTFRPLNMHTGSNFSSNKKKKEKRKDTKKKGKCNWCGIEGHWEDDCRKKKAYTERNKDNSSGSMSSSNISTASVHVVEAEEVPTPKALMHYGSFYIAGTKP